MSARFSGGAFCYSIAGPVRISTVSNLRRWARCAHLALPTCLLRWWVTNPAWQKERLNEYSIECHNRTFHPVARNAGGRVGSSSDVLVDSTRALGEPFDLHRATGCRHRLFVRLRDQHGYYVAPHRRITARPGATARFTRHEIRTIGGNDHGDSPHRGSCLFSRRPVWGAPRSQHPVLEVAAGFRSHHCALEADYSARDSATSQFRNQPGNTIHHARAEQRNTGRHRPEHRGAMDRGVVLPRVSRAALSPSHGPRSLVRPTLWLAADGFSMGTARSIHMGFLAALRDLRGGEGCIQHFAFPRAAVRAPGGARGCYGAAPCTEGFYGNTYSRPFLQHAGSVDGASSGRGISLSSGPAATA